MKKTVLIVTLLFSVAVLFSSCSGGTFKSELSSMLEDTGDDLAASREAMCSLLETEFVKEGYPVGIVGTGFGTAYHAGLENGALKPLPHKFLAIAIPHPVDEMGWSEKERKKIIQLMEVCTEYEERLDFEGWLYVDENFERFPVE